MLTEDKNRLIKNRTPRLGGSAGGGSTPRWPFSDSSRSSSNLEAAGESSFSSPRSADTGAAAIVAEERRLHPTPVPGEPNLYYIPSECSPIYRPVPLALQASVWLASAAIGALTWFYRAGSQSQLLLFSVPRWKRIVWFFVQTVMMAGLSTVVLLDIFWGPSRGTIQTLLKSYWLPSRLSKYRQISLRRKQETPPSWQPRQLISGYQNDVNTRNTGDETDDTATLGVHFLESVINDDNDTGTMTRKSAENSPLGSFRALYVNHGFGASSLSWLPAIKPLQAALNIPVALGHDAPGFGFTERPMRRISLFTSAASAAVGLELLIPHLREYKNASSTGASFTMAPVLLMGHSMGAMTTLRMALGLGGDVSKHIVLVSPALGVRRQRKFATTARSSKFKRGVSFGRRQISRCLFLPRSVVEIAEKYILRRVVGAKNSWRNGLRLAWGDPNRLKNSDVLRFQWPSIGAGWEAGLLAFSRAQSLPTDMTDKELMENVLELPNTTVSVIVGSKDSVVPAAQVRRFLADFPSVCVMELDGLGHDSFEEDTEAFVRAVRAQDS